MHFAEFLAKVRIFYKKATIPVELFPFPLQLWEPSAFRGRKGCRLRVNVGGIAAQLQHCPV